MEILFLKRYILEEYNKHNTLLHKKSLEPKKDLFTKNYTEN